jgi:hypothetical protein
MIPSRPATRRPCHARRSIMTRRSPDLAITVALATLGLAFAAGAAAQTASPKGGTSAKSGSAILTPTQLRNCVDQKERLQKQSETAAAAKAEVDAQKAEVDKLESELAAEIATVDRTSEEAVNAFNAKVARRDRLLETYQSRVDAFNAQAREVQATKSAHEKTCENRRYDERDMDDIKRKK